MSASARDLEHAAQIQWAQNAEHALILFLNCGLTCIRGGS
jgi:hypothetical protein